MACAPTGSGKTLAFVLPLLHHLREPQTGGVRALILSPTKELAEQVCILLFIYINSLTNNILVLWQIQTCHTHQNEVHTQFTILRTGTVRACNNWHCMYCSVLCSLWYNNFTTVHSVWPVQLHRIVFHCIIGLNQHYQLSETDTP